MRFFAVLMCSMNMFFLHGMQIQKKKSSILYSASCNPNHLEKSSPPTGAFYKKSSACYFDHGACLRDLSNYLEEHNLVQAKAMVKDLSACSVCCAKINEPLEEKKCAILAHAVTCLSRIDCLDDGYKEDIQYIIIQLRTCGADNEQAVKQYDSCDRKNVCAVHALVAEYDKKSE